MEKSRHETGHFCNLRKIGKVNNRPIGENWPNPVTLICCDRMAQTKRCRSSSARVTRLGKFLPIGPILPIFAYFCLFLTIVLPIV
jgi:hypothetical protein